MNSYNLDIELSRCINYMVSIDFPYMTSSIYR